MSNTMEGKVSLITGGASGIGKETVRGLLKLKAEVVFTVRNRESGEKAIEEMLKEIPGAKVSFFILDLASFDSVRSFVTDFLKAYKRLDVLINNAGVMTQEREETIDHHEMNWQVNFLSPVLLTNLLLSLLRESAPSRIINVSSTMHKEAKINFEDLESRKSFNKYDSYGQSKLALILWTKYLAKELEGSGVAINALHPGVIGTEITMQHVRKMNPLSAFVFKRTLISAKAGAETSIYLASSPEVLGVSGEYFVKKKVEKTAPQGNDMAVAQKLVSIVKSIF